MIEVKIDANQSTIALADLRSKTINLSPALREIGELLIESTRQRFASGMGPDGVNWQPNSPVTIEHKVRNQPLVDHGTLENQISYDVVGDTLYVGSTMEYAAMQQHGGSKLEFPWLWDDIPARPFLGISLDDEQDLLQIIKTHISVSQ